MFDTINLQILAKKFIRVGALALAVTASGCASIGTSIDRCKRANGIDFDITALAASPSGDILAGGTVYRKVRNCVIDLGHFPEGFLLATSNDHGKSWVAMRIPLNQLENSRNQYELSALAASKDGTVFAGVNLWWHSLIKERNDNARLLRSDDSGFTWKELYDFGHDWILSTVIAPDSVVVAALCGQGIMRSQDNGKSWAPSGLKSVEGNCSSLELISNNAGELYAYAFGRNGPGFYRSADAGVSWIRMAIPAMGRKGRIAANDKGDVVATVSGPSQQEVYRSSDHGKTWKKLTSPNECWTEQLGIAPDGTILLKSMDNIFCGANGGSFISTDGGESWTRLNNRWTGENNIPGEDPLVIGPSGLLFAHLRANFPRSTIDWGGTIYYSNDSGRSWHAINPLVEKIPE